MNMNTNCWIFPGCCLALLTGCAVIAPPLINEPVGPDSGYSSGRAGTGYLRVYSETFAHDDGHIFYYPHSSYAVHSPDGRQIKWVQNHIGLDDDSPTVVPLPSGSYYAVARSEAFGLATVPLVIEAGALTPVFLERGGMPTRSRQAAGSGETNFVKGPDGAIVGWRLRKSPAEKSP